jgi:DNA-directed RNA polymerase subunit beta'
MSILSPNKAPKKQVDFVNRIVDKGELRRLLSNVYSEFGTAKTGALANALKNLGFKFATRGGVTISIEDLKVPERKKDMLSDAEREIEKATQRFLLGEITEVERYTKVIDTWSETTEKLTKEVVDTFDRMNPIYMMAFSGARGNISQVRQLVGMRGLMADSQGQIIDLPIKTNFREGLSVTEYIISSYGARKGIVDTALKTADSGYLTRRLVDVAQDVIITEADCATQKGVMLRPIKEGDQVIVSLEDRIVSRTAAVDVVTSDGEVLAQAGEVITPKDAKAISKAGIKEVLARSGLTCETAFGICQKCYGWSLTSNKIVDLGEAIGIMAAQSIGEPGTQLTMRTFHTGGVFAGSAAREKLKAKRAGKVTGDSVPIREFRTRHGDVVDMATRDTVLQVTTADGQVDKYTIPYGAIMHVIKAGTEVTADMVLAEWEPGGRGDARRLTEKATKDITSEMSGEIVYDGFEADEKRDRQGNISRTANRGGTIWVLGGDVYNLPAGSSLLVDDKQPVFQGDVLAETLLISEHGGEVRLPEDLETEVSNVGGKDVETIINGKELTIIIASVAPTNAQLVQTKKEMIWQVGEADEDGEISGERYIIKSPHGTMVENGSIIAELIDDSFILPSSGELRYEDIETDEQGVLLSPGKVLFIPEEIHQVSKDISLKAPGIESGMFVKAGTEVVSGVTTRIDGIVEIVEDNDIIHEVIIRPGELHRVKDVTTLSIDDGTVVEAGTEVAPGIVTKERCLVSINFLLEEPDMDALDEDEPEDATNYEYAEVLLRPVHEYEVSPQQVEIEFSATEDENIKLVPVTQLQYKDGDKVRQVEGASILRTSLVLQMTGYLQRLKGVTELQVNEDGEVSELKIVVLENLTIRRDNPTEMNRAQSIQTQLLVKNGQVIDKKTPVVKTQVLARTGGSVSLGNSVGKKEIRRILVVTPEQVHTVQTPDKPQVRVGDFVKAHQPLTLSSFKSPVSGLVTEIDDNTIQIRVGRPYLISIGTQLQADNRTIAQQGDLIATLIFERQKTGDIVQGLPRVEELLEGRKPKERAILASYAATAEIVYDEDVPRLFLVSQDYGREEVQVPVGANILVEHQERVTPGQPLTDGSIDPHDILQVVGVEAVRTYLVDEVQRVYRSQGVEIADKHIEIIVRQMSKKVQIDDGGDTYLLPGELVDQKVLDEVNREAEAEGRALASGHPVLLGITKASLNTDSFISAASFQETTRVLTEAAVEGKRDFLRGLKENVIIGRLIPAGTGFPHFKDERDDMFDDEQAAGKTLARKPSAILEEIESMFGSPEISMESLGSLLLDDSDAPEMSGMMQVRDREEDENFLIGDDSDFAPAAEGSEEDDF